MRKALVVVAIMGFVLGCTTAAKQAVYTATGPQGSCLLVKRVGADVLGKYKTLEIAKFENELPGIIDTVLVNMVRDNAVAEMAGSQYFASVKGVAEFKKGGPGGILVLRGRLTDMTSDKIPGQKLISGGNHLIARVELLDKATGKVLAYGNVRGVVKSVVETGEEPLAKGMARGIKKMFKELLGKS